MRNVILTAAATLLVLGQLIVGICGFAVKGGNNIRRFAQHIFPTTKNTLPMTTSTKRKTSLKTTAVTSQTAPTRSSRRIRLPLRRPWTVESQQNLQSVLQEIVDSTAFFVNATTTLTIDTPETLSSATDTNNTNWMWSCSVPAFGEDCRVQLQLELEEVPTLLHSQPTASLVLSLLQQQQGSDHSNHNHDDDFGWICTKLYECSPLLNDHVDCGAQLRDAVVLQHSNRPAASAAWNLPQTAAFERMLGGPQNVSTVLRRLNQQGYVIIDHVNSGSTESPSPFSLVTTAEQQKQLSDYYLREASSQGPTIRTDRVHFLSRTQAAACNIQPQYDLLVGIANYLNDHHHVTLSLLSSSSPHTQPAFPATLDQPLTLPRSLQFAEYGQGDYYIVRSTKTHMIHVYSRAQRAFAPDGRQHGKVVSHLTPSNLFFFAGAQRQRTDRRIH